MAESKLPKSLKTPSGAKSSMIKNLDQWVATMRQVDRSCYKMMAIEVWAIAKTMEALFPGFWNRFMTNRQEALKQFMEHKQNQRHSAPPTSSAPQNSDRPSPQPDEQHFPALDDQPIPPPDEQAFPALDEQPIV